MKKKWIFLTLTCMLLQQIGLSSVFSMPESGQSNAEKTDAAEIVLSEEEANGEAEKEEPNEIGNIVMPEPEVENSADKEKTPNDAEITSEEEKIPSESDVPDTAEETGEYDEQIATMAANTFWWEIRENTLYITGDGYISDYSELRAAPWKSRSFTKVVIADGITGIGNYAFYGCSSLVSITIPESVTFIGYRAFYNCFGLGSITIPGSVTKIGSEAFYYSGLKEITIPEDVTVIGNGAFSRCAALTEIQVSSKNSAFSSDGQGVLYDKNKTTLLCYPSGIAQSDFYVPDSVVKIDDYAFYGCWKLTNVIVSHSVKVIGKRAFSECTQLTNITLPNSVTAIESYAFSGSRLKSIMISGSVTSVGWYAFSGCEVLEDVYYTGSKDDWDKIKIESGNEPLTSATVHYNYYGSWRISADGVLTISDKDIPDFTYSEPAPWSGKSFTSVVIENGVTRIGNNAFRNSNSLEKVTIPSDVTQMGVNIFLSCKKLSDVTIMPGLTNLGSTAFSGCTSLENIVIPNGVTSMGDGTFSGCTSLEKITIPDSVTRIGEETFSGCTSLENITIPDSVTIIGKSAFSNCTSLVSITIPDSIVNIESYAFSKCTGLESISIPDGTEGIGVGAFQNCTNLSIITVPESVTYIGGGAFSNTAWYDAQPNGTVYIGKNLYKYKGTMSNFKKIDVESGTVSICQSAFNGCENLRSITIPESVMSIGYDAFSDCTGLTNVTLSNGLTSIEVRAFRGCKNLKNIIVPNTVVYIGNSAFQDCANLVCISLPHIESIESYVFYGCTNLTGVAMPNTVTTIGFRAFYNCKNLKYVYYNGTENEWAETQIGGQNTPLDNAKIVYDTPTWSISSGVLKISDNIPDYNDVYKYERIPAPWISEVFTSVMIEEGVDRIGDYAFSDCPGVTDITIPNSVTHIGKSAFENCSGLKSIIIPEGVQSIGECAFEGCKSLTSVEIPNTVTRIEYRTFYGCEKMSSIIIPDSVEYVGINAFSGSAWERSQPDGAVYVGKNLYIYKGTIGENTHIDMNADTVSISPWAFPERTGIVSITIPNSVKNIGSRAFYGCKNLKSVTIPDSVTKIESECFSGCTSLASIVIGSGVIDIEPLIFLGCENLDSVYIDGNNKNYCCDEQGIIYSKDQTTLVWYPQYSKVSDHRISGRVKTIGKFAFYQCSNLTNVTIPAGVTSVGYRAFFDCDNLASIIIPASVVSIDHEAFDYCNIKDVYYTGTKEEWNKIKIGSRNQCLTKATIHYSYDPTPTWSISSDGVLTISGRDIPDYTTDNPAPWYGKNFTSVVIGDGVTRIGENAFWCSELLEKATIPSGVTQIGNNAFSGCTKLSDVVIPSGVTSIGNGAFTGCGMTAVTIPESVLAIGTEAFSQCPSLCDVTIRNRNTSFGNAVFQYGKADITIHGYYNSTAEAYAEKYGYPFAPLDPHEHEWNDGTVIVEPTCKAEGTREKSCSVCGKTATEPIPKKNHSFGAWVVTRKPTETEYGEKERVCSECGEKETSAIDRLGGTSIIACSTEDKSCGENLVWVLYFDGTLKIIGKGKMTDFADAESTPWYEYSDKITAVIAEDGVESIGAYAFTGCRNLKKVTWTDSVKSIGQYAFGRCSSLAELTLPEKLESIGYYAFYYDSALTHISFGKTVSHIGSNAFVGCSSLTAIEFADGTGSIPNGAFYNCIALQKAVIPESVTEIGQTAFDGCDDLTIFGYGGSYAQTYAKQNGIPFVQLDEHVCSFTKEWTVEKEATVFQEGLRYRNCDVCGKRAEEAIPKLPGSATRFTVVDARNPDTRIADVKITVLTPNDGNGIFYTDENGEATADLPLGKLTASVEKAPYLSRIASFTVLEGENILQEIGISTGSFLDVDFSSKIMDLDEIIKSGIDVTAPGNQQVFDYEIKGGFITGDLRIRFIFNGDGDYLGYGYETDDSDSDPSDPGTTPGTTPGTGGPGTDPGTDPEPPVKYPTEPKDPDNPGVPGIDYFPPFVPRNPGGSEKPIEPIRVPSDDGETVSTIYPVNEKLYLIIHGQAKWLKEMFDVQMLIVNNSLTDTVEDCDAAITLPDGLSLADMISEVGPQSLVQHIDMIGHGETHSVHWYVRGDEEGEYSVTGSLDGRFMPFEEKFHYEYELDSPIKVYAGSALHMTISVPEAAYYGEDYTVRIQFENVSPRPIYGFTNSILGIKQCKVTRYSDGSFTEEIYTEDNEKKKAVLDTFNPGDKLIIEISSNILIRSEAVLEKLSQLSDQIDNLELLINAYRAVAEKSEMVYTAGGYLESFIEKTDAAVQSETDSERKAALTELALALSKVNEKFNRNDISALNVVNGLIRYGCFDDVYKFACGTASMKLLTAERADAFAKVLTEIAENDVDTETVFAALRDAIQTIPMRFILEDVTVVTLEGSTTEIPYSVEILPDESPSHIDFVRISRNINELVKKASGSLDIPWFVGAVNGNSVYGSQTVRFDKTAYFAAKSATGKTKYKVWIEPEYGISLHSVEDDFTLTTDAADAVTENGKLSFTGSGYVTVTSLTGANGTLYIEMTEGDETHSVKYELKRVSAHTCNGGDSIVLVQDDYTLDGVRVKTCSVCGDITDVESFRTKFIGDANKDGKITAMDKAVLERYLARWNGYGDDTVDTEALDLNGDGKVTAMDAAILERFIARWKEYDKLPYIK